VNPSSERPHAKLPRTGRISARNEAIFTEIRPKLPYGRVAREPFAKGNARYDLELGWPVSIGLLSLRGSDIDLRMIEGQIWYVQPLLNERYCRKFSFRQ